jgi:site-specific DNA-methyltransferase (cytosine-N4-specific)
VNAPAETSAREHHEHPPREVGLEVRAALTPKERHLLQLARLDELAPAEAWTVLGTSRALAYGTHGIFRYFGKFPPPIARELLLRHSVIGDAVLDPMAGSGTTAVEAASLGRQVVARDVSPLSLLLCRVKTTHVTAGLAEAAFSRTLERAAELDTSELYAPVGLRHVDHWFLPQTRESLGRLRAAIEPEPVPELRDLLLTAFASTVRRVSRATTQQGRLFLDAATAREDAVPTFSERYRKYARAVAALPVDLATHVALAEHDAKQRSGGPARFRLAIVHPPYFNNYKYSAINALELAWLGFLPEDVRPKEIREAFKVGRPERAEGYVADLARALAAVASELVDGGSLCLMLGDTVIRGEYVDVSRRLLRELRTTAPELRLQRVILRVPRYTEASWVTSQRRKKTDVGVSLNDFLLTFTKAGDA